MGNDNENNKMSIGVEQIMYGEGTEQVRSRYGAGTEQV